MESHVQQTLQNDAAAYASQCMIKHPANLYIYIAVCHLHTQSPSYCMRPEMHAATCFWLGSVLLIRNFFTPSSDHDE